MSIADDIMKYTGMTLEEYHAEEQRIVEEVYQTDDGKLLLQLLVASPDWRAKLGLNW